MEAGEPGSGCGERGCAWRLGKVTLRLRERRMGTGGRRARSGIVVQFGLWRRASPSSGGAAATRERASSEGRGRATDHSRSRSLRMKKTMMSEEEGRCR